MDLFEIKENNKLSFHSGLIERTILFENNKIVTTSIKVNSNEMLSSACNEIKASFRRFKSGIIPKGLQPDENEAILSTASFDFGTDSLNVNDSLGNNDSAANNDWSDPICISDCDISSPKISTTKANNGKTTVKATVSVEGDTFLQGLEININYELFDDYPVIRKWVEICNNTSNRLKLEDLVIESFDLDESLLNTTELTPSGFGSSSSIIAYSNNDFTSGLITCSEIPSALRKMDNRGGMGYSSKYFEWVLEPNEQFISEAVFIYAFCGEVYNTISGLSKPLDRLVEGEFKPFLNEHIGIAGKVEQIPAPLWCTWSNFGPEIDDASMREQADIASMAGFKTMLIDDGWQRGRLGTEPDKIKFPDFKETCRYITEKGLRLGLWVSSFRDMESKDIKALPNARSVPLIKRLDGYAMSFSGPWRDYYADDLASFKEELGATYIKQDFTNIKFGDIAEGHGNRTRKESLLKGIRGLINAQKRVNDKQPEIWNEVTHEIYWGTPGVPCDLAVLKHAKSYHVPPNDYSGVGHWKQRYSKDWDYGKSELQKQLIDGCFNARNRFYEHRGLPLHCIEYYGAATVNVNGSLAAEIQDRQICSWLMGAPFVFAGDLASLTQENIKHYKNRFSLVEKLQNKYSIYSNFNFSGVPAPTDTDWHWWGKLNNDGCGAVVIMRGSQGENKRKINIPWVKEGNKYEVKSLLNAYDFGVFSSYELISGALELKLPQYGQEILEINLVKI